MVCVPFAQLANGLSKSRQCLHCNSAATFDRQNTKSFLLPITTFNHDIINNQFRVHNQGSHTVFNSLEFSQRYTYKHILYPLFVMVAFEVLTESLSIRHLVAHLKEEFLPICSQTLPSWRHNFLFHDIPMQNIYPLDCITDQNCEGG